jgi:hypothetical protein
MQHGTCFQVANAPALPDGATVLLCGSDYALGCWDTNRAVTMHASDRKVSGGRANPNPNPNPPTEPAGQRQAPGPTRVPV